ncbi:4-deoxy-L-threo-5-hexosulose-uronate ketol-isomerase [Candidatus Calditenuaceae archaeon HR02]|nr:4-deoxy-L-threo-5-hexosulose-uronate ketol-isomerase [Candidatus Calditenuaceae archaeon HR02]
MRGRLIRARETRNALERLFATGDFALYHVRARRGEKYSMEAAEYERIVFSTDGALIVNNELLRVRDMIYTPRDVGLDIQAEGDANIYVAEARGFARSNQFVKRFNDAPKIESGQDCYARTIVVMISEDDPVDRFLAGYTESIGASWTSYPPHRHDGKPEAYIFYGMNPGFGVQLLMDEEGEEAHVVRDGDVVLIERGYHPNVGTSLNGIKFAWIIAAPHGARDLSVEIHPLFRSVPVKMSHLKIKETS